MANYRDARAIHISSLKRWRAALRTTSGNPHIEVFAGQVHEVKREAVEAGIEAARKALAKVRMVQAIADANNGFVTVAQYDLTTGKSVYWRMIRRDVRLQSDHVISGWLQLPSEAAFKREAKRNGCHLIERGQA